MSDSRSFRVPLHPTDNCDELSAAACDSIYVPPGVWLPQTAAFICLVFRVRNGQWAGNRQTGVAD